MSYNTNDIVFYYILTIYVNILKQYYTTKTLSICRQILKKKCVRSGIRTHAWRTRLRPERSALDRSAILTS